eukprot:405522_1
MDSEIDEHTMYLVRGYIRKIQKLHDIMIPMNIIEICIIFYFISEEWNKNLIVNNVNIQNNIITNKLSSWCTSFLSNTYNKGHHQWIFKVKKKIYDIFIGICLNHKYDKKLALNTWIGNEANRSYAFSVTFATVNKFNKLNEWEDQDSYGIQCKDNDIISMMVDFDSLTLSYCINNKNYGIAHHIKAGTYVVAVTVSRKGESIEFVKHKSWRM